MGGGFNPIKVIGGVVGGIIGAPFGMPHIGAAIGGGLGAAIGGGNRHEIFGSAITAGIGQYVGGHIGGGLFRSALTSNGIHSLIGATGAAILPHVGMITGHLLSHGVLNRGGGPFGRLFANYIQPHFETPNYAVQAAQAAQSASAMFSNIQRQSDEKFETLLKKYAPKDYREVVSGPKAASKSKGEKIQTIIQNLSRDKRNFYGGKRIIEGQWKRKNLEDEKDKTKIFADEVFKKNKMSLSRYGYA